MAEIGDWFFHGMTESEIRNSLEIWRLAKESIAESKKQADVGMAIEISDREAQVEKFLRDKGFPVPEA